MSQFSEVRILVDYGGQLHSLCKLGFVGNDSIYLFPYALCSKYFYGGRSMAEHQVVDTFDFTDQQATDRMPKLSIHESGRVHIRVGDTTVGPVYTPQLATLRGEHIAAVATDVFEGLPVFQGILRQ